MSAAKDPPVRAPLLEGRRIILRPVRESDVRERLLAGRDPEFHRLVGGNPERAKLPLSLEEAARWQQEMAADATGWAIEAEERLVGTTRLHGLDSVNLNARFAIGIFRPADRDRGYGTEATRLVLRHAFERLRLHRVEVRVLELNTRAISLYERCGFVREGVQRECLLRGGEWLSDLMMSILEPEYHRQRGESG